MDKRPTNLKEALQIAIAAEIKAYNLYQQTSAQVATPAARAMLAELAAEEKKHRELLEGVLLNKEYQALPQSLSSSPGIAQFLVPTELTPEALPQDILIFAIQAEEKAYRFYLDLKAQLVGTELEELFARLAAEERRHQTRLEDQYEQDYLSEN